MKRVAFAVPGDLETPTGGYAYDRRMIAELQQLGWQVDVIGLGDGFPRPERGTEGGRADAAAGVPAGPSDRRRRPGASACLPEAAAELARAQSADRAGASSAGAGDGAVARRRPTRFRRSEREALAAARARHRHQPFDRGAPDRRLRRAGRAHHRGASRHRSRARRRRAAATASCGCLSVGAVVPRKGYDVLIAALAPLADLPWRLTIAGDRTRDPKRRGATRCRYRAPRARRSDRRAGRACRRSASRRSMPEPTCSCWRRASRATAWPSPRRWRTACRSIGTTAGAIPDTVPPDAGVLVEPNDVQGA